MEEQLFDLYENTKKLKRSDVKNTENKLDKEIVDMVNNKEFALIIPYLKQNGKPLFDLITAYMKKIGTSKIKTDPNLQMLAPIIAAMKSEVGHND